MADVDFVTHTQQNKPQAQSTCLSTWLTLGMLFFYRNWWLPHPVKEIGKESQLPFWSSVLFLDS